jgi:hypothetical protein
MNAPNSEFVSLADVLALALEARSLTDESISLEDEATVTKLLMHAPLDQEDPKVRLLLNLFHCNPTEILYLSHDDASRAIRS